MSSCNRHDERYMRHRDTVGKYCTVCEIERLRANQIPSGWTFRACDKCGGSIVTIANPDFCRCVIATGVPFPATVHGEADRICGGSEQPDMFRQKAAGGKDE